MGVFQTLSVLALRQLIDGAGEAIGYKGAGAVTDFFVERFTDQSQRLTKALQNANERAWKALEIALAGDSLWNRCKSVVARSEDKAFGQQVRAFLDATSLAGIPAGNPEFCQACLRELRTARDKKLLTGGVLDPKTFGQQAGDFARFADPQGLLDAEGQTVIGMAGELAREGYRHLAALLTMPVPQESSLLVIAVRYFFRRAVEDDPKLFQGLAYMKMEGLQQSQELAFAALHDALREQGQRLELLLGEVQETVARTHGAVLDVQEEQRRLGEQLGEQNRTIYDAVIGVQKRLDLMHRVVLPRDSMSIRNDSERQLVKELLTRYRTIPQERRQEMPALLNAIGKLEVAAGNFNAAQRDFATVATLVNDKQAKGEAHANAYRAALEQRDWATAFHELIEAVKLDGKKFAPFPVGKYHPQRILGAGGFGVVFLCKHKYMDAQVVVKVLTLDGLDRDADQVFSEAQLLKGLDHPGIIRMSDCGYADAANKSRPFLIMDYFAGLTLEEYAIRQPLSVQDMLVVARQMAEGLQVAHANGILHLDVKPGNVLVRKSASAWQVKLIDFGLARRHSPTQDAAQRGHTLMGRSIAGTLNYGAPEQLGHIPGNAVGPYSDVYGFARTCCYALFKTPHPRLQHWKSIPEPLAELLNECVAETPDERPQDFVIVLKRLDAMERQPQTTVPAMARNQPEAVVTVATKQPALPASQPLSPSPVASTGHRLEDIGPSPANSADTSPLGIITRFATAMTRRLQASLGDAWWTWDGAKEIATHPKMGDVTSLGKAEWAKAEPDLQIVLAYDGGMPGEVYFTVRAGENDAYTPIHPDVGVLIVQALKEKFKAGRGGQWWPRWWVSPEKDYRDWSKYQVVLELAKAENENRALQYFVNCLVGMAKTVESVLDDLLMRHSAE